MPRELSPPKERLDGGQEREAMIGQHPFFRRQTPLIASCRGIVALTSLISFLVLNVPSAAEVSRQLKGAEIKARFADMEFTDETHFGDVFDRSGRVTSYAMGKKSIGTWRIEKQQLCVTRQREEQRCYEVWILGASVELREPGFDIITYGVLQRPDAR